MTRRQAQRIARKSVHVSYDGPAGRPDDWVPKWIVWVGAGTDGFLAAMGFLIQKQAEAHAKCIRAVIVTLLTGGKPRAHDRDGWIDEKAVS